MNSLSELTDDIDDSIAKDISRQIAESIVSKVEAEALVRTQRLVENGYLRSYGSLTASNNYIPRKHEEQVVEIETLIRDTAMLEQGKVRGKVNPLNKLKIEESDLIKLDRVDTIPRPYYKLIQGIYRSTVLSGNNAIKLSSELFKWVLKSYKKATGNEITEISLVGGCCRINKQMLTLSFIEGVGNFITIDGLKSEAPRLRSLLLDELGLRTLVLSVKDGNALNAIFKETAVQEVVIQAAEVYRFKCTDTTEAKREEWESLNKTVIQQTKRELGMRGYCNKGWGYDLSSQLQDLRSEQSIGQQGQHLTAYYKGLHRDLGSIKDKTGYYGLLAIDKLGKAIETKMNKPEKDSAEQPTQEVSPASPIDTKGNRQV